MNEKERELVIKEARLNALRDVEIALAKIEQERGAQDELGRLAQLIRYHLGQQISEVAQDKAGQTRLDHTLWGEQ
jgi:hypothetical protein